jgi:transcriptional antiterminator RfaH
VIGKSYNWYVLYTRTQHERRIQTDAEQSGIETCLPLVKSIRFWSDRKKVVFAPLFPNYVFVKISCVEYYSLDRHPSVLYFVKNSGYPVIVPESTISTLKVASENDLIRTWSEPEWAFQQGNRVIVIDGLLRGYTGYVTEHSGNSYVIITVAEINQSVLVRVNPSSLRAVC